MPDLSFTSSGVAEAISSQERLKIGAQALKDLYKQQNLELSQTARETQSAIRSTLTDAEKIQRKIDAIKQAQSKGVGDQAKNTEALKRLEAQLAKVQGKADGAGKSLGKAFGDSAFEFLSRWVGPTAAIGTAMGVITNEMRSQLQLIDEAASEKMTVSQSRNVVLRNLPGVDAAGRREVLAENQRLASEIGVDETFINQARADALSASGGDRAASLSAVRGAARFLFDRPGEISGFAGSLLDLSKATGTFDANTNLGLLTQVAGLSRVTDPGQQAANIPAALIGATGFGMTTAEAAGLFATLTEFSGDLTGQSGSTATIKVAQSLRDFKRSNLTGTQSKLLSEEGLERLAAIENLSTGDKLRALQQDSELSQVFLKGVAGEAKFKAQVEQLVGSTTSAIAQKFAANVAQVGSNEQLAAEGRRAVAGLDANELNRQTRFESGLGATAQRLAVADPNENLTAQGREDLLRILQRTGQSRTGATVRSLVARLKDDSVGLSVDEAIDLINPVIADLEDGRARKNKRGREVGRIAATKEELEAAEALKRLVALTEQSLSESKKQTQKVGKIPTR